MSDSRCMMSGVQVYGRDWSGPPTRAYCPNCGAAFMVEELKPGQTPQARVYPEHKGKPRGVWGWKPEPR